MDKKDVDKYSKVYLMLILLNLVIIIILKR